VETFLLDPTGLEPETCYMENHYLTPYPTRLHMHYECGVPQYMNAVCNCARVLLEIAWKTINNYPNDNSIFRSVIIEQDIFKH
jgi:hypothetical protein